MRRNSTAQNETTDCRHPHRATRTAAWVVVVLALSWAYLLCGLLPEPAGGAWRKFLLSNPRNPPIGLGFMLPATVIPILLAFRHGRSKPALGLIIPGSYVLAVTMEWMMRRAVHSWAALELPPFDMPLWSAHRLVSLFVVVAVATLMAAGWCRSVHASKPPAAARGGSAAA